MISESSAALLLNARNTVISATPAWRAIALVVVIDRGCDPGQDRVSQDDDVGALDRERNKEVARRLYEEVFGQGRLHVADELVHPECRDLHDPQDRRGPARAKEVATMLRGAFPDQRWEIEQLVAEGDHVAVYCTWSGTHEGSFMGIAPTGRRATVPHMYLLRLRAGQVIEYAAVRDDLGMMRQLGLVPAGG
jgi:predicted ester cyclase